VDVLGAATTDLSSQIGHRSKRFWTKLRSSIITPSIIAVANARWWRESISLVFALLESRAGGLEDNL